MADLSTVATEARRLDPDRFLGALFAPDPAREHLWSLIAFDATVADVPGHVHEPGLGLIRLQWWRDAIAGATGSRGIAHPPVVAALADLIDRHQLTQADFEPLLAARETELESEPPDDITGLEQHADAMAGAFVRLAFRVVGAASPVSLQASARVASAHALVRIAQAIPARGAAGRPLRAQPAQISDIVRQISVRSRTLLAEARALRPKVERAALPLLLPAALLDVRIDALAAAGFDPYAVTMRPMPLAALRLAWAAVRSRY